MATHSSVLTWRISALVGCRLWGRTESTRLKRLSSSSLAAGHGYFYHHATLHGSVSQASMSWNPTWGSCYNVDSDSVLEWKLRFCISNKLPGWWYLFLKLIQYNRGLEQGLSNFFSLKDEEVKILGFAGREASVSTTQLSL